MPVMSEAVGADRDGMAAKNERPVLIWPTALARLKFKQIQPKRRDVGSIAADERLRIDASVLRLSAFA
jgi:hypothetical protein